MSSLTNKKTIKAWELLKGETLDDDELSYDEGTD